MPAAAVRRRGGAGRGGGGNPGAQVAQQRVANALPACSRRRRLALQSGGRHPHHRRGVEQLAARSRDGFGLRARAADHPGRRSAPAAGADRSDDRRGAADARSRPRRVGERRSESRRDSNGRRDGDGAVASQRARLHPAAHRRPRDDQVRRGDRGAAGARRRQCSLAAGDHRAEQPAGGAQRRLVAAVRADLADGAERSDRPRADGAVHRRRHRAHDHADDQPRRLRQPAGVADGQQRDESSAVRRADHQQARSDDAGLHSRRPDDGDRRARRTTRKTRNDSGHPVLSRIPFIGTLLFGNTSHSDETTRAVPVPHAAHHLERRRHRQAARRGAGRQRPSEAGERRAAHRPAAPTRSGAADTLPSRTRRQQDGFADDASAPAAAAGSTRLDRRRTIRRALSCRRDSGDSRPAGHEHSATELLEVERLTTALSADWLEQYGVLPLRLDGRRARRSARGSSASSRWRSTTCVCCSARAIVARAVQRARPAHGDSPRLRAGGRDRRGRDRRHDRRGATRSTPTRFRSTTCCIWRTKRRSSAS